ncbi:hypothetical protein DMENIID0001_153160 [Sergentomyia squamirostris]
MVRKIAVLLLFNSLVGLLSEEVPSRVGFSKEIKLEKAGNSRQGRFFGLLSLLAGLSLSDGLFFDPDTWLDSEKPGLNINNKIQSSPYGVGWPYSARYVPVLIPASYFTALKYYPGQMRPETFSQQIVNVDSPVKTESYKEVNPKQTINPNAERFTRETAEIENRNDMEAPEMNSMSENIENMETLDLTSNSTETSMFENPEIQTVISTETTSEAAESSEMSELTPSTTPMSFEVGMSPELEELRENVTINEVEKPPSWSPSAPSAPSSGMTSSYYRQQPPKGGINIDDVRFTTIYPPIGTSPPDTAKSSFFQASPLDETHLRRGPESFQPLLHVPIFWGNR